MLTLYGVDDDRDGPGDAGGLADVELSSLSQRAEKKSLCWRCRQDSCVCLALLEWGISENSKSECGRSWRCGRPMTADDRRDEIFAGHNFNCAVSVTHHAFVVTHDHTRLGRLSTNQHPTVLVIHTSCRNSLLCIHTTSITTNPANNGGH